MCKSLGALDLSSDFPRRAAAAASRADEEEPGGSAQGARGKETSVRGREGELGDPAAHPRAAETRQVSTNITAVCVCNKSPPCPLEGAVYPVVCVIEKYYFVQAKGTI